MAHLIVGMILAGLGVWGIINWWNLFGLVMRGVIPFFLLLFGLVAILAATRRVATSLDGEQFPADDKPGKANAA